jgi:hypothetical protein
MKVWDMPIKLPGHDGVMNALFDIVTLKKSGFSTGE